ncbi:MAG: DNA repair protein RecO [Bdellovibrionales bacterium]|nr:DNA repair protein RecO [Bdellovibrionales bacterium]
MITDKAIILKTLKHGESDLVIHAITSQGEKIPLFARSALKSKKRFGGGILEPTHCVQIHYKPQKAEVGLSTLLEADLVHDFSGIRTDYSKLELAFYFLKFIERYAQEGLEDNEALYKILGNGLKALESDCDLETLRLFFEVKVLYSQGVLSPMSELQQILAHRISEHGRFQFSVQQRSDIGRIVREAHQI